MKKFPDPKQLSNDYNGRCGNCHKYIGDDRYCRYCGTKSGEGKYEPYEDCVQCVYGPMPVEREHICPVCGKKWTTCLMLDRELYCPDCGSETNVNVVGKNMDKDNGLRRI